MDLQGIFILTGVLSVVISLIVFIVIYVRKINRSIKETQADLTDKGLIEFIDSQPDKMVNSKLLMKEYGLTKFEARNRLQHFLNNGLLRLLRTRNGRKSFYALSRPIDRSHDLDLTNDPFMTVEDLMMIFKHNEYQVTLQEICLSTGLPIKVIKEEMKYFEKERVIQSLLMTNNSGFGYQRVYTLCEPYRSNPDEFLALKNANFELKEIYKNELGA